MIHGLDEVRPGFEVEADVVVVGSGAGGAVSALNLAEAGLRTVVLEAGPAVPLEEMERLDAPRFLARYFWEGGLRTIGGSGQIPTMQGRCLGGSTVVNSAIMFALPDWVRGLWAGEAGLDFVHHPAFDEAYARVFARTRTAPTPLAVMGRRNLLVRDALEGLGMKSAPLPRAVEGCEGCGTCVTGCAHGHKLSTDRSYIPEAVRHGARVFTCAAVERVLSARGKVTGVMGSVVDPVSHERTARFVVRAPRVVLAAGAMHTPVLLQASGLDPYGTAGSTLFAHMGAGVVGIMDEPTEPWFGATQGWGAMSDEIRGMKFESLWAHPSLLMVRWGDVGLRFLERVKDVRHATVIAMVYRARTQGSVRARWDGSPRMKLFIPEGEVRVAQRGLKMACDALLKVGARFTYAGIKGTKEEMRTAADTEELLDPRIEARDLPMTANHVFGSCRMSRHDDGTVDLEGRVRGVEGLWITDASVFPSPSGVNPQATIMALADLISRRIGERLDAAVLQGSARPS